MGDAVEDIIGSTIKSIIKGITDNIAELLTKTYCYINWLVLYSI